MAKIYLQERRWRRNWAVLCAITVHGIWGCLLLFSDAPLHTTPLAEFPVSNRFIAAAIYLMASALAACPVVWPRLDTHFAGLLLTIPQQYMLMLSAFTGVMCGLQGRYPDGYVPAGGAIFIWADQSWAVVGMFAHTFALIDWYWFSRKAG